MKLIIKQGRDLIAVIEDYTGPIPRVGEYIFHPPLDDDGYGTGINGTVATVTYGILARPTSGHGHFVGRSEQVVEVCYASY